MEVENTSTRAATLTVTVYPIVLSTSSYSRGAQLHRAELSVAASGRATTQFTEDAHTCGTGMFDVAVQPGLSRMFYAETSCTTTAAIMDGTARLSPERRAADAAGKVSFTNATLVTPPAACHPPNVRARLLNNTRHATRLTLKSFSSGPGALLAGVAVGVDLAPGASGDAYLYVGNKFASGDYSLVLSTTPEIPASETYNPPVTVHATVACSLEVRDLTPNLIVY